MGDNLSWPNQPLQTWFAKAKLRPFPLSPSLDCRGCSRSKSATTQVEAERWRKYKCCTFQPFVPNFLLGAMLETRSLPETTNAVISPLGLCPTGDYREKFFATPEEERGEDLICALFDKESGQCSVWKNRPSECSSYFCKESAFYRNRSQDLFEWEIAVAQMALIEHGFSNKEVDALIGWMDWDEKVNLELRWKDYLNSKEDYFRSCWDWAKQRTGSEIYSWLSPDVQARFDSWLRFDKTEVEYAGATST